MGLTVTNLGTQPRSIDWKFSEDRAVRRLLAPREALDLTGIATLDELQRLPEARALLDAAPPAIAIGPAATGTLAVLMDDAPDVSGGGTTGTVGFTVQLEGGTPISSPVVLEFAAFDDAEFATPAGAATLDSETAGTILTGAASAALLVATDAAGRFTCILTNPADTTVYLACRQAFGSAPINAESSDSVTFSA